MRALRYDATGADAVTDKGTIILGIVHGGTVRVGDLVTIPLLYGAKLAAAEGIECNGGLVDQAGAYSAVALLIPTLDLSSVVAGGRIGLA